MKKSILSIVALATLVVLPISVSAQGTSKTSTVSSITTGAKIITPIYLSNSGKLDFGTIIKSGTSDSIRVTPANVRSAIVMGDGSLLTSEPSSTPTLTVTGEAGYNYHITLPTTSDLTSGTATLTASKFTTDAVLKIDTDGSNDFHVGATLFVPSDVTTGTYAGSFEVTVAYD
jgi:hypothetical protein